MTISFAHLRDLGVDGRADVAAAADAFDAAWQKNPAHPPDIAAFLPADPRIRAAALVELACLDLGMRLGRGAATRVEDYLGRLPELKSDVEAIWALVTEECTRRRLSGEAAAAEYIRRYPQFDDRLRAWLKLPAALPTTVDAVAPPIAQVVRAAAVPGFPCVPGYEILGELGHGGMGIVYKARHLALKRIAALKMILGGAHAGRDELGRFRAEAQAVARLDHPNIVQIYEVGEFQGRPFLALEFCGGGGLDRKLNGAPLPPAEAAALAETLARAVQAAHAKGVVHRDLKPANVLRKEDGTLKVSDFGLAKRLDEDSGRTRPNAVMGTPSYMAPEQAAGRAREVGPAADVWALGAILYEFLTGRPPFRAAAGLETLELVRTQDPVPPRRLNPKAPRDLETICLKCLQKAQEKRYASAEAVAEDLRRFRAGEPIKARPLGPLGRAWRWGKRHPAATAVCAALAALLLAGVVYWQTRPAYLDVRVFPPTATVLLDGQPLTLTDGRALAERGPGRHHLAIHAEGCQDQEQQVILVRGQDNTVLVNVALVVTTGYLHRTSEPPGATVEVVSSQGEICARGATPFFSPRLLSGVYTLRLRKDLYQPAEVTMEAPTGDRVAEGDPVKLETDPQYSESALLFEAMRKMSEETDYPRAEPGMSLFDYLAAVGQQAHVHVIARAEAFEASGRADLLGDKWKTLPASWPVGRGSVRTSLRTLLRDVLGRHALAYTPTVSRGTDGFNIEVTTPKAAGHKPLVMLYPVGDLVPKGMPDAAQIVRAMCQTVHPNDWGPGGTSACGYLPVMHALEVRAPWSVQEDVQDYLTELRADLPAPPASAPAKPSMRAPRTDGVKPLWEDDFGDPKKGFMGGERSDEGCEMGYKDGCYAIRAKSNPGTYWCWPSPTEYPQSFAVQVVGRAVGQSDLDSWGVILWNPADEGRGFTVMMNRAGRVSIDPCPAFPKTVMTTQGPFTQRAIEKGDAYNNLLLIARGGRFEIYVNDLAVCDPVALPPIFLGPEDRAHLSLGAFVGQAGMTAEFKRIAVWSADQLPPPEKPTP